MEGMTGCCMSGGDGWCRLMEEIEVGCVRVLMGSERQQVSCRSDDDDVKENGWCKLMKGNKV